MRDTFAALVNFVADALSKILAMTEQALKLEEFANALKTTETAASTFSAKVDELTKQHNSALQAINENITSLVNFERSTKPAAQAAEQYGRAASRASVDISKMASAQKEQNKTLEETKRITEEIRTPQEVFADNIAKIDGYLAKGYITLEAYNRATTNMPKI